MHMKEMTLNTYENGGFEYQNGNNISKCQTVNDNSKRLWKKMVALKA